LSAGFVGLTLYQPGGLFDSIYFIEEVIVNTRSRYQDIMIARIKGFGKSLILDGWLQSTEADEYIYHESLVHPAMIMHDYPRQVLVLGGGEGATLREVLKYKSVEEAVMVDIDPLVVELSKKYLTEWHQGSFEDPRSKVMIMDGFEYVRKASEEAKKFDVVVMDLTDPYGSEIAMKLYSSSAFQLLKKIMDQQSILVVQAGSSTLFREAYERVEKAVSSVFKHVAEYVTWVPSFAYMNSFIIASDTYSFENIDVNIIDERVRERGLRLRFFNARRMVSMFGLAGLRLEGYNS